MAVTTSYPTGSGISRNEHQQSGNRAVSAGGADDKRVSQSGRCLYADPANAYAVP